MTLEQAAATFIISARKVPRRLPETLSRQEVDRILVSYICLKHRTMLMTTYSVGLGVSERCNLTLSDIDRRRMMLRVVNGKDGKDRWTLLSPRLLDSLRQYSRAKERAGTTNQAGIHSMRHASATELPETGVDLHTIKERMGHDQISSTRRYLHLRQQVAHLVLGLTSSQRSPISAKAWPRAAGSNWPPPEGNHLG